MVLGDTKTAFRERSRCLVRVGILAPHFFSFIFPIAGSKTGAHKEVGQGRAFCARRASGRKRRALTNLPRSVQSYREKWKKRMHPLHLFSQATFVDPLR